MGFFSKLFGKPHPTSVASEISVAATSQSPATTTNAVNQLEKAARQLDKHRMSKMFERAPSFSLIIFAGDCSAAIPELLGACKYTQRSVTTTRGNLSQLYVSVEGHSGPNNSIVRKGACVAEGFTILLDPEMLVGTSSNQMGTFCREQETMALAVIWERVSETVMATEYSATGITRETHYTQGIPDRLTNPHPQILPESDHRALLAVANDFGLNLGALTDVSMTVYELQE